MITTFPDIDKFAYPDGEEWLICHLLKNNQVDAVTSKTQPHFFKNPFYAGLYGVCSEYSNTTGKGEIHFQSILAIIASMGKLSAESLAYLNGLYEKDIRQAPAIDYILEQLESLSNRRKMIFSFYTKLNLAMDINSDIKKIAADAEEDLLEIQQGEKGKIDVIFAKDVPDRRRAGLEERYSSKPILSYWEGFDKVLSGGFEPGKLSIIAGRTSMGKSFFKTNLIINMCKNGIGVINICPEQGFDSEHDRIDSVMTGIHLRAFTKIRDLPIGDPKFEQIKMQQEIISSEWNYACVPNRTITVAGVRNAIRRARRGGLNPQVVFIDLFDRLDDVNVAKDRAGNMSKKLQEIEVIMQQENVHLVLLVQVNRGTESRKEHRPMSADLRDCGSFEQDADNVFLLYREGYYNKDLEDNILEVEIAKQRSGAAGVVYNFLIIDKETLAIAPIGQKTFDQQPQS